MSEAFETTTTTDNPMLPAFSEEPAAEPDPDQTIMAARDCGRRALTDAVNSRAKASRIRARASSAIDLASWERESILSPSQESREGLERAKWKVSDLASSLEAAEREVEVFEAHARQTAEAARKLVARRRDAARVDLLSSTGAESLRPVLDQLARDIPARLLELECRAILGASTGDWTPEDRMERDALKAIARHLRTNIRNTDSSDASPNFRRCASLLLALGGEVEKPFGGPAVPLAVDDQDRDLVEAVREIDAACAEF